MISDELSSRIDSLEIAIELLSKRLDSIERTISNLNVRTSGLQMIGGFNTNKYLDDLNLKSFDLKHDNQ